MTSNVTVTSTATAQAKQFYIYKRLSNKDYTFTFNFTPATQTKFRNLVPNANSQYNPTSQIYSGATVYLSNVNSDLKFRMTYANGVSSLHPVKNSSNVNQGLDSSIVAGHTYKA